MDNIKKVFRRGIITSVVILVYGILSSNQLIYIGMFIGSLLSLLGFYMICLDVKSSVMSSSPFKVGVIGYLKRYLIYGVFLGTATYFYGLPMLISGLIGLLNVKFNILLMTLFDNIRKLKIKYLN
ncbi:MAG: ATPase [Cetobacterium sp.]|uniref:ATPase n=1 Tax=Cetobacterium sp. TaxID=2071632 RepID=UPI002FC7B16D